MAVPSWIILTILIVIILFLLFRTMNEVYLLSLIKKNFFWYFALGLIIFMTFSLYSIHKTYDLDLTSADGLKTAGKVYLGWIGNVFKTMGKVIGYVIKQDWVATNSTI